MKVASVVVGFAALSVALTALGYAAARVGPPPPANVLAAAARPAALTAPPPPQAPTSDADRDADRRAPLLPALFVVQNATAKTQIVLAGPRAKPLLLHLWASWCGPCRAELPALLAFHGPAEVLAVTVDDRFDDVMAFFGGNIPAQVAWDSTISLERALGVHSIPTTFLIDTAGRVIDRYDGAQAWQQPAMVEAVREALAPHIR